MADRDGADRLLAEGPLEPAAGGVGDLGIEADVEIGRADRREIGRRGTERGGEIDVDAERVEQPGDLDHVVAMAEAQRGRAEDVGRRAAAFARRGAHVLVGERPDQLVEGLRRAPILLALIARQLERDTGHRQAHRLARGRRGRPGSARRCMTRRPASPAAGTARTRRAPPSGTARRYPCRGRAPGTSCR